MDFATILEAANSLSREDRIRLVEAVSQGIDAEQPNGELSEELKQELERRIADDDANPDEGLPVLAAKKLDIGERTLLAWELWSGMQEEMATTEITEELEAELDHRFADFEAHPENAVPWEQVLENINRVLRKERADDPHIRPITEDPKRTDP